GGVGGEADARWAGGKTPGSGGDQISGTLKREQFLDNRRCKCDVGQRHVNNLSGLLNPGLLGRTRGTLGILWSTKDEAAGVMVNRGCAYEELWLTDGQKEPAG